MHSKQIKIGPNPIKNRSFFGNKNSGFPNVLFSLKAFLKSLFLMSRRQFLTKALFDAQLRKEMKSKGLLKFF